MTLGSQGCSARLQVLRALTLRKAVLLEGSPGVGKTALVAALARRAGVPLVRCLKVSAAGSCAGMQGAAPRLQLLGSTGYWALEACDVAELALEQQQPTSLCMPCACIVGAGAHQPERAD